MHARRTIFLLPVALMAGLVGCGPSVEDGTSTANTSSANDRTTLAAQGGASAPICRTSASRDASGTSRPPGVPPSPAEPWYEEGRRLAEAGDVEAAKVQFERALKLDPDYAPAHNGLGSYYGNLGQYERALKLYEHAIRLDPGYITARTNRTSTLGRLDRHDEAIAAAALDVQEFPNDIEFRVVLAGARFNAHRYDEALSDCNELIRLDPTCSDTYYLRAYCLEAMGDSAAAEESVSQAEQLGGSSEQTEKFKILRKIQGKVGEETLEPLNAAIRTSPADTGARLFRALIFVKQQRYDDAHRDLDVIISLEPANTEARLIRVALLMLQERFGDVIHELESAVEVAPEDPKNWSALAIHFAACPDAQYRDGRKALACAQRAGTLANWAEDEDYSNLAAAYAELGDFQQAVHWQQRAVEMAQSAEDRSEEKKRLQLYLAERPFRLEIPRR